MNQNTSSRLIIAVAAFTLLGSAHAQLTWDTTIAADGTITEGAGTWTTGAGNWNDGATSDGINWTDGDSAIFGGGTEGTAGTVVLGSNITTAATQTGISFSLPFDGSYTLDTSTFTLTTGGIKLNGGSAAVLIESTGVGGKIELNATNTWSITNGPLTVTSQITGAFGINKFGAGHMYLSNDNNSFTGALSLNNGGNTYLATIKNSGVNSAAGAGSKIIIGNNADLFYTGTGDTTDRTLQVTNAGSTIYNNGTGALVFTGAFANTNNKTTTKTLTLRGSNTDANEIQGAIIDSTTNSNPLRLTKTDNGTWKLSGANTYTGATSVNDGILIAGSAAALGATIGSTTVANGATLDVQANIGTEALSITGTGDGGIGALSTSTGTGTVGGLVTMTANASIGGAGTLNVGGAIDGAFALTKIGAGTTTLSGANTYTGTTNINGGVLVADVADVAATSGALGNGGDITFTGGTLQYTANSAGTDYSSRITGSASAMTFDTNGQDVILANKLAGNTGGLAKLGLGQLTAAWNSTYTGITTVEAGTLVLSNDANNANSSSSGFFINNGSTLELGGSANHTVQNRTFTFGSTGGGTLTLSRASVLYRSSTIVTTGGSQNTFGGTASLNMQNTYSAIYTVADGTDDIDLVASLRHDRGSITKNGDGTLSLTNNTNNLRNDGTSVNTVTINGGTLELSGGGQLRTQGSTAANWTGNVINDGVYRHNSTANQELSGVVSGSGGIEVLQNGSGSLTLSGANTYTGATTVDGTLVVDGSGSINTTSGIVVSSGGTFDYNSSTALTAGLSFSGTGNTLTGSGTINTAVTITDGNILSVGNSPGTMNFASGLTLDAGSLTIAEIDGTAGAGVAGGHDFHNVTGALTYGGDLSLVLGTGTLDTGTYSWDLFDFGSESGSFASIVLSGDYTGSLLDADMNGVWDLVSGDNTWEFNEASGVLGLTVVPEPSAYALLLGVFGMTFVALRRRR